jgi:hypothetical protein
VLLGLGVSRCSCSVGVTVVWFLGIRWRVGSVRVRATYNPARYASNHNGCHAFLKDKKISTSPRRRFWFRLLWRAFGFCQSAWSTDPACGSRSQRRSRSWCVEDTRGNATPPWRCLGKGKKEVRRIPWDVRSLFFIFRSPTLSPPCVCTAPLVLDQCAVI